MLQNRVIYLIVVIFFLFSSCINNQNNIKTNTNKYCNNQNLQYIEMLHQEKNNVNLMKLLGNNPNNEDLQEIIYSLSITNDTINSAFYLTYLSNNNFNVRIAAAYAIGQLNDPQIVSNLIDAYNSEKEITVKKAILISISKCATPTGAKFIANIETANTDLLLAQGDAFFYLAQRGLVSMQMIDKVFQIIDNPNADPDVQLAFSNIFIFNLDNVNLNSYFQIIKNNIKGASNIYLAINLARTLKYIQTNDNLNLINEIINSELDYRIKVFAIDALKTFSYSSAKKIAINALSSDNSSVAQQAAQYLLENGNSQDAQLYFQLSKKIVYWQPRTTLLSAALKYSGDKNQIENNIISGYKAVDNIYEKAALLFALSYDPNQYKFVKDQTFNSDNDVISKAGINSLYAMRLNPSFDRIAAQNPSIVTEFNIIFKEAVSSQNSNLIYYAAKIINNTALKIIDINSNTYFLNQAMSNLQLPADYDAFTELCKAINNFGSQTCNENPNIKAYKIDWTSVCSISTDTKVKVKTTKGNFIISLYVDQAPVTVEAFLSMVDRKLYNNTYFYKLIPATAIVNGGINGDGSSALNLPILLEHNNLNFTEGCVAMKTLGDKYQSLNWFITLMPTPQYNNNYTIFGKVTQGLDIVHKLEVGDKIIEITLE